MVPYFCQCHQQSVPTILHGSYVVNLFLIKPFQSSLKSFYQTGENLVQEFKYCGESACMNVQWE